MQPYLRSFVTLSCVFGLLASGASAAIAKPMQLDWKDLLPREQRQIEA